MFRRRMPNYMETGRMYTSIGRDNFDLEILSEERLVLLAGIRRDYDYKGQTDLLRNLSKRFEERLKICLLDEESFGIFTGIGIEGSPAFVLFIKGKEKGRILGKADIQSLSAFITRNLSNLKEPTQAYLTETG